MKLSQDKMNLLIIIGTAVGSMLAGMVVGCLKEKMKMKMDSCCIIDEM